MPFAGDGHWIGEKIPPAPLQLKSDGFNLAAMRAAMRSIAGDAPIILTGPVGTGKTTILAQIARAIWKAALASGEWTPSRSERVMATWLDEPLWWTTADAFVRDVRASWSGAKFTVPDYYTADGLGARVRRLFLDDLGAEARTDSAREEVVRLIVEREKRGLPTWVSTNLTVSELIERYGERAMDRLRAQTGGIVVEVGGPSRRGVA